MLLALHTGRANQAELALLGNAFLCARVLYNVVYILAFNVPLSILRSAVWSLGLAILLKIFSLAVPDINYA